MRKMYLVYCIVTTFFIIYGDVDNGFATGPSGIEIRIVPVTYNESGSILFKTHYYINYTGEYTYSRIEYGWLVVSGWGRWEEYPHKLITPIHFQNDDRRMMEAYRLYEKEFGAPFNWVSPPASVQLILQHYGFTERDNSLTTAKEAISSAIKETLRICDECENRQRSLHNLTAALTEDDNIEVIFYHAGVALIKNVDIESQHIGVWFEIPNFMDLGDDIIRDYGIEYQEIDGIFFLSGNIESLEAESE